MLVATELEATKDGTEGVKWELELAGFALGKWETQGLGLGFGHWE